ncbi:phage-related conserved hypothetical protein [Bordetella bronchiseptica RB50]|uniref:Uncharacterized protein n=2 Tax=Bordetella bronchiseptica TaxID=518 RepID=A0A0H3LKA9_BORBR|nr:phage-related conserved hypothetical protein [Bordetella bronchiseptica RB50]
MTPERMQALLAGQTSVAKKVFAALPSSLSTAFTPVDIAREMKAMAGASVDIHTMRGCLACLQKAGLVKEVVPGSFRRVEVKEKHTVTMTKIAAQAGPKLAATQGAQPPMDMLASIAAKVRVAMAGLGALADEIDNAALAIEERSAASEKEVAKVKQIATLLKELG